MKLILENWRQYLNEGSNWDTKFNAFISMLLKDYPNSKITEKENWDDDEDIGGIVHNGKYWNQEVIASQGLKSACHGNSACAYDKTGGRLKMCTGVALSSDGNWYLHSWVYNPEKDVIYETTETKWGAYYGYQIPDYDMNMILSRGDKGRWAGEPVSSK